MQYADRGCSLSVLTSGAYFFLCVGGYGSYRDWAVRTSPRRKSCQETRLAGTVGAAAVSGRWPPRRQTAMSHMPPWPCRCGSYQNNTGNINKKPDDAEQTSCEKSTSGTVRSGKSAVIPSVSLGLNHTGCHEDRCFHRVWRPSWLHVESSHFSLQSNWVCMCNQNIVISTLLIVHWQPVCLARVGLCFRA